MPVLPLVEIRGLCKSFGRVAANRNISLRVFPGRIKALLGENGAGKSTLMSMLAGRLEPDAGEILVEGRPVALRSPKAAHAAGIGMVHQHFMLLDSLSVAENVLLGHEEHFFLNPAKMRDHVADLAARYGLDLNPGARVRDLSMGERQRVEILKLLCRECRLLIFDEPTAVLTALETAGLFAAMRNMASQGKAVIFISHKLPEVLAVADEVAILRRGEVVDEFERRNVPDAAELARRMLGGNFAETRLRLALGQAPLEQETGPAGMPAAENVLECKEVSFGRLREVSFKVRKGDILAVVGVAGNGQKELAEILCGAREPEAGTLTILDRESRDFFQRPPLRNGLVYIPEDRAGVGACLSLSLLDNFLLTTSRLFSGRVILRRREASERARSLLKDYGITPDDLKTRAGDLSGGNLQKLVIGRELARGPRCIVAENPTQGLDIAATEEVWRRLRLARAFSGILLLTGDVDEALVLADHIAVIYRGRIVDIFGTRNAAKIARIGLMMAGGASSA